MPAAHSAAARHGTYLGAQRARALVALPAEHGLHLVEPRERPARRTAAPLARVAEPAARVQRREVAAPGALVPEVGVETAQVVAPGAAPAELLGGAAVVALEGLGEAGRAAGFLEVGRDADALAREAGRGRAALQEVAGFGLGAVLEGVELVPAGVDGVGVDAAAFLHLRLLGW